LPFLLSRSHFDEHLGGELTHGGHSGTLHRGLHFPFLLSRSHFDEHLGAGGGLHGGHSERLHSGGQTPLLLSRSHFDEHFGVHLGHAGSLVHAGSHIPALICRLQKLEQVTVGGRKGSSLHGGGCPFLHLPVLPSGVGGVEVGGFGPREV
jgi:hypothetical protein